VAGQVPLRREGEATRPRGLPDRQPEGRARRRDAARKLLASHIDPSAERRIQKASRIERAGNSFETVAREWFAKRSPAMAESHKGRVLRALERDVFPCLGTRPVAGVTAPELLAVLRRVEARGAAETAQRIRPLPSSVPRRLSPASPPLPSTSPTATP